MSTNTLNARLIGGIDPGLASGGFVVIDRADQKRVLEAHSLVEEAGTVKRSREEASVLAARLGGWSDIEFLAADMRAQAWVQRFISVLNAFEAEYGVIDMFGVESFVDQAQHAKKMMKNRWQTPFLTGMLVRELAQRDITAANGRLIYQNAGTILSQLSEERGRLEARRKNDRDLIVPGDRQVTNEHQRSALAHALALDLRLPPLATTL